MVSLSETVGLRSDALRQGFELVVEKIDFRLVLEHAGFRLHSIGLRAGREPFVDALHHRKASLPHIFCENP